MSQEIARSTYRGYDNGFPCIHVVALEDTVRLPGWVGGGSVRY